MRTFIVLVLLCIASGLSAQADTIFVLGADFGSYTSPTDSTYIIDITHSTDQLGQAFTASKIQVGYQLIDAYGRLYRVKTVDATGIGSSTLTVVELQNSLAPSGSGVVYRKPDNSDCIPEIPDNDAGISAAVAAKIANHNAVNGCGGGVLAATLADSMALVRDSLEAIRGDIGSGGGGYVETGETKYCGCRGQSNMEGRNGNPPSNPQILLAQTGGTTTAWNPTDNNPCYSTALEWINNNPLDTVVCFWTASGGTSISEWYPTEIVGVQGELRADWEGILSDHGNPVLDWSIWMQGERDRDNQGINSGLYGAEADTNYYNVLIDSVYLYDTGQDYFNDRTPFVVGLVYDGPGAQYAGISRNNALKASG